MDSKNNYDASGNQDSNPFYKAQESNTVTSHVKSNNNMSYKKPESSAVPPTATSAKTTGQFKSLATAKFRYTAPPNLTNLPPLPVPVANPPNMAITRPKTPLLKKTSQLPLPSKFTRNNEKDNKLNLSSRLTKNKPEEPKPVFLTRDPVIIAAPPVSSKDTVAAAANPKPVSTLPKLDDNDVIIEDSGEHETTIMSSPIEINMADKEDDEYCVPLTQIEAEALAKAEAEALAKAEAKAEAMKEAIKEKREAALKRRQVAALKRKQEAEEEEKKYGSSSTDEETNVKEDDKVAVMKDARKRMKVSTDKLIQVTTKIVDEIAKKSEAAKISNEALRKSNEAIRKDVADFVAVDTAPLKRKVAEPLIEEPVAKKAAKVETVPPPVVTNGTAAQPIDLPPFRLLETKKDCWILYIRRDTKAKLLQKFED